MIRIESETVSFAPMQKEYDKCLSARVMDRERVDGFVTDESWWGAVACAVTPTRGSSCKSRHGRSGNYF